MSVLASRKVVVVLLIILAAFTYYQLGSTSNADLAVQSSVSADLDTDYQTSVKPILEQRCVVCHACYDAPCQLKLGSMSGIQRGANKERVYDGERLIAANLTRLFQDAHSQAQWREKEFFPVVNDSVADPASNSQSSVMFQLLSLKQKHPLPSDKLLSKEFDLELNRDYQCPTIDEVSDYIADYPLWGMPYGLPKLSQTEHAIVSQWITQGAKGTQAPTLNDNQLALIEKWEGFFNQDSLKAQLTSRYLYEHLFLVNLHFADDAEQRFFKLVRSATPPGQPIKGIFTRRPFDDPKVARVYYRIQPVMETVAHKSHMPVQLSDDRMERWHQWFIETDYQVEKLPDYEPSNASNPFITFAQLPVKSRYRYMLDESQNTIMQFIKGPVCRGQMALNVINDHFWVMFSDPDLELVENNNRFMQQALQKIRLPAEKQSTAMPTSWINYAAMERDYLKAKSQFIEKNIENKVPVTLDLLWDGDGHNPNLALTVFRHNDAATVVKGLVGDKPQTAWVLTYPLFERIHYLLVAGYDVYGNLGHQLNSRMYMDFLRMEGEFNFLSVLPRNEQKRVRNKWYRGSVSEVEKYVYQANEHLVNTDIDYTTEQPLDELYGMMKRKVADVESKQHRLSKDLLSSKHIEVIQQLNQQVGKGLNLLPHSSIIRLTDSSNQSAQFYTLLRHSAHSNISHLFNEQDRRLPKEDTLTLAPGLMTSHPNALMDVSLAQLEEFASRIAQLQNEQDYQRLMDDFGVRRSNPDFWQFADQMHQHFRQTLPVEFGYLDFNRLENR